MNQLALGYSQVDKIGYKINHHKWLLFYSKYTCKQYVSMGLVNK